MNIQYFYRSVRVRGLEDREPLILERYHNGQADENLVLNNKNRRADIRHLNALRSGRQHLWHGLEHGNTWAEGRIHPPLKIADNPQTLFEYAAAMPDPWRCTESLMRRT
ncbi:hypothetical protein ACQY74_006864 (plasmid) [Rhizobium leguminosarum bv. trifolii]